LVRCKATSRSIVRHKTVEIWWIYYFMWSLCSVE